jgi:hypothetical protein
MLFTNPVYASKCTLGSSPEGDVSIRNWTRTTGVIFVRQAETHARFSISVNVLLESQKLFLRGGPSKQCARYGCTVTATSLSGITITYHHKGPDDTFGYLYPNV